MPRFSRGCGRDHEAPKRPAAYPQGTESRPGRLLNQEPESVVVELVRRAQAGDQQAYAELFHRYQRSIFHLMNQMVRDREEAAGLTQDAFVRAYRQLHRLRAPEAWGVWLRRIAMNIGRDHLKRRRLPVEPLVLPTGEERLLEDPGDSPDRIIVQSELLITVRRAIDRLPEEHRLVVTLHHLEGMEVKDIAEVLGIPVGTVKSRLSRARGVLRDLLGPYLEEPQ